MRILYHKPTHISFVRVLAQDGQPTSGESSKGLASYGDITLRVGKTAATPAEHSWESVADEEDSEAVKASGLVLNNTSPLTGTIESSLAPPCSSLPVATQAAFT